MKHEDAMQFSELLFAYKHLWIRHQEFKYMTQHPQAYPETVRERFAEAADKIFQPLADAILDDSPLQEVLRALVRNAEQAERNQNL